MEENVGQLYIMEEMKLHTIEMRKRKEKTRPCEKCRPIHLERGTPVSDGSIPQIEEVEMVWTCVESRQS